MDSDGVLEEDTNAGTTSGKDFWLHRSQKNSGLHEPKSEKKIGKRSDK